MINKNLIIVGKNSFLGSHLYKSSIIKKKLALSYKNFFKLKDTEISKFNYICNCSVHKNYKYKKYSIKYDLDLKIFKRIKHLEIKYIFLSSRKIYKPKFNIKENNKPKPVDRYAMNKLKTENYLKKFISNKVLILRISNIIGPKIVKKYRQVNNTFFDNYLKILTNKKKFFYNNSFKDFISIHQFLKIFKLIINKKLVGIFNLSLGKKVFVSEIIQWLNLKNPKKELFIKNENKKIKINGSFTLNNSRLLKKISYRPTKKELKNYCLKLSKLIHE